MAGQLHEGPRHLRCGGRASRMRFVVSQVPKGECKVPGHGLHFVSRHPLQFSDSWMRINSAGEAEAGSAGEQPAEE